jgi:hypothetical protein
VEPAGRADEALDPGCGAGATEHVPKGYLGYDPLDLGGPRYVSGEWRLALADAPFEPLREARLRNPQTLDREGLVAFFASMG